MDQDAFRKTYREVNERFCVYEKAILTNQCKCSCADKFCIAEREGVHCITDRGQSQCTQLIEILREQARFALHDTGVNRNTRLPHGKAIKVQVGGLRGVAMVVDPELKEPPQMIEDIDALVSQAIERFGSLERLPFSEIMQQIAAYKGRQRRRK